MYYCQRKPKNRKNGVGLGTRLAIAAMHVVKDEDALLNCDIILSADKLVFVSTQRLSMLIITILYFAH